MIDQSKYEILTENHQANQMITRPSLIYVPFCSKPIHNNLLFSNWSNEKLKDLLFFGNSLKKFFDEVQFDREKFFYIDQAVRFASDVRLPSFGPCVNALNEQVFTSFDRTESPPVDDDQQPIVVSKREKKSPKPLEFKRITIDQVPEQIWLVRQPPVYSVDDEILLDASN